MGVVCTCQGCGVATNTLSNLLLFASGAFTFLHGIAFFGRVLGSDGEAQAAVANNLRGITGNNATTAAQQEIDDSADATMRIITNAVAFTGHCTGLVGIQGYRGRTDVGRVAPVALKAYLLFLPCYSAFTLVFNLRGIADTEDYCERQDSEPDCEESSLEWGLHVLFVYQMLQLLTLWGVYSLWTGLRDAELSAASQTAVVITPAKPHIQEHELGATAHGRTMAMHGRQPLSRGGKLDAGPHKSKHYKHSVKGQAKGAKKGKGQNSLSPPPQPSRRVIPIYGV